MVVRTGHIRHRAWPAARRVGVGMFVFFSSRMGCLGSLLTSLVVTLLIIVMVGGCASCATTGGRGGEPPAPQERDGGGGDF